MLQIFTVEFAYDETIDCEYIIQYCSIINILCFLLNHKSFSNDMIYASVQHYNDNDQQTYSKMYTED